MKPTAKKSDKALSQLQETLHFPDETIDFHQNGIWVHSTMEKQDLRKALRNAIYLALGTFAIFLAVVLILYFMHCKSN